MKKIILPLSAATALTLASHAVVAADTVSNPALTAQVNKLAAETKLLKKQVRRMRKQLAHQRHKKHTFAPKKHNTRPVTAIPYSHFISISTAPFVGKKTSYTPFHLLEQTSSNNEDLTLLKKKREIFKQFHKEDIRFTRPMIDISGGIEGQLHSTGGFNTSSEDGVNLSTAQLDLNAYAGKWAQAFMSLSYSGSPISQGNRLPNSRIYLKRGFLTIGNLDRTPFYGSIGLIFVPFGRYSSGMLSSPLTLSMGRIRSEAALIGFSLPNGIFGSIYGYAGNQRTSNSPVFQQGGVNLSAKSTFAHNHGSYDIGAQWVTSIADAQGMQNTGFNAPNSSTFSGFANASNTLANRFAHTVGGVAAHATVRYRAVTFMGEYISATRHFAMTDLSFNGKGAEPKAMHLEINYILPFDKKTGSNIGFAYGRTWEALALNLPEDSYTTYFSTSLLRNTVETIEYRHDTNYSRTDVANGQGAAPANTIRGTSSGRNSVIGQVGVYF